MIHRIAPADYARVQDQARHRAEELRQQAITHLMNKLGHALHRAATPAARAARRWARRLARHQRLRQAASSPSAES